LSPILGIWASAQQLRFGGSYESIQTVTVGSGGATDVTFSAIPATYTHLQIRAIARHTNADTDNNIYIQYNSDTASNYSNHFLRGNGASVDAGGAANTANPYVLRVSGASSSANIFGVGVVDILDYANTNKFKTVRSLTGHDQNGSGVVFFNSSNWRSTSAITSITLFGIGFNIAQYSSFALYGIKGS
jgi:hypothetical protein